MDRPGFAGSSQAGVMPDLEKQARLLAQLLPLGKKALVVGHSLGGPLLAWIALQEPSKVCAAIMVASFISSRYEASRWYNFFAANWLAKKLLPNEINAFNKEMMVLQQELQKLEAALPSLTRPLIAIQGMQDNLVHSQNVEKLARFAPKEYLHTQRISHQGYFFHWKQLDTLIRALGAQRCD